MVVKISLSRMPKRRAGKSAEDKRMHDSNSKHRSRLLAMGSERLALHLCDENSLAEFITDREIMDRLSDDELRKIAKSSSANCNLIQEHLSGRVDLSDIHDMFASESRRFSP